MFLKLVMVVLVVMCFYFFDCIGCCLILIGSVLIMGICMCVVFGIKGGFFMDDDIVMKGVMVCFFVW